MAYIGVELLCPASEGVLYILRARVFRKAEDLKRLFSPLEFFPLSLLVRPAAGLELFVEIEIDGITILVKGLAFDFETNGLGVKAPEGVDEGDAVACDTLEVLRQIFHDTQRRFGVLRKGRVVSLEIAHDEMKLLAVAVPGHKRVDTGKEGLNPSSYVLDRIDKSSLTLVVA